MEVLKSPQAERRVNNHLKKKKTKAKFVSTKARRDFDADAGRQYIAMQRKWQAKQELNELKQISQEENELLALNKSSRVVSKYKSPRSEFIQHRLDQQHERKVRQLKEEINRGSACALSGTGWQESDDDSDRKRHRSEASFFSDGTESVSSQRTRHLSEFGIAYERSRSRSRHQRESSIASSQLTSQNDRSRSRHHRESSVVSRSEFGIAYERSLSRSRHLRESSITSSQLTSQKCRSRSRHQRKSSEAYCNQASQDDRSSIVSEWQRNRDNQENYSDSSMSTMSTRQSKIHKKKLKKKKVLKYNTKGQHKERKTRKTNANKDRETNAVKKRKTDVLKRKGKTRLEHRKRSDRDISSETEEGELKSLDTSSFIENWIEKGKDDSFKMLATIDLNDSRHENSSGGVQNQNLIPIRVKDSRRDNSSGGVRNPNLIPIGVKDSRRENSLDGVHNKNLISLTDVPEDSCEGVNKGNLICLTGRSTPSR